MTVFGFHRYFTVKKCVCTKQCKEDVVHRLEKCTRKFWLVQYFDYYTWIVKFCTRNNIIFSPFSDKHQHHDNRKEKECNMSGNSEVSDTSIGYDTAVDGKSIYSYLFDFHVNFRVITFVSLCCYQS